MDLLLAGLLNHCRLRLVQRMLQQADTLLLSLVDGAGVALGKDPRRLQFLNESGLALLLFWLPEAVRQGLIVLHHRHHLGCADVLPAWPVSRPI